MSTSFLPIRILPNLIGTEKSLEKFKKRGKTSEDYGIVGVGGNVCVYNADIVSRVNNHRTRISVFPGTYIGIIVFGEDLGQPGWTRIRPYSLNKTWRNVVAFEMDHRPFEVSTQQAYTCLWTIKIQPGKCSFTVNFLPPLRFRCDPQEFQPPHTIRVTRSSHVHPFWTIHCTRKSVTTFFFCGKFYELRN